MTTTVREPGRRVPRLAPALGGRASSERLRADGVSLGYDEVEVVRDLSLSIPTGRITGVVGPNACGKSTVLQALARLLPARGGRVVLDGEDIHRLPTREVARRLGVLPQTAVAPDGITVTDLVARGRYPHQSWFRQWSAGDERAVAGALAATGIVDLADRPVDSLSGGQRQRAWIAMALAQETDILLLDEPTTFLDLAHQMEVLDLLESLNESDGRTIVMVLHDLNHAARYAHHLVALRDGQLVAQGEPAEVVTEALVRDVLGLAVRVVPDPVTGTPLVVPLGRDARAAHRGDAG
ncbi:MAG: ABC transporter ATP-binding protein [Dermatophilaceae bacterium]